MAILLVSTTMLACTAAAARQPPGTAEPTRDGKTWSGMQAAQAFATARLAASPRRHEWVDIEEGGRTIRAFVTYPSGTAKVPIVIVLHEVFGLTDATRSTADQIAALGYVTVAPDMLSALGPGGGGSESFLSAQLTSDVLTSQPDESVDSALDAVAGWALRQPGSDERFAVVGLSWGGGAAFRYAAGGRHDPRLRSVAVFYDVGPPAVTQGPSVHEGDPPVTVATLDVPVYGFYPSEDARVMRSLPATTAAMAAAGKRFEPVVYLGADHAYMRLGEDPSNANRADAAAVCASLARLKTILAAM